MKGVWKSENSFIEVKQLRPLFHSHLKKMALLQAFQRSLIPKDGLLILKKVSCPLKQYEDTHVSIVCYMYRVSKCNLVGSVNHRVFLHCVIIGDEKQI